MATAGTQVGQSVPVGDFHLHRGDALKAYAKWPSPDTIISDGAYGLGGFPGDPPSVDRLQDWYAPHIERFQRSNGCEPSGDVRVCLSVWRTKLAGCATLPPGRSRQMSVQRQGANTLYLRRSAPHCRRIAQPDGSSRLIIGRPAHPKMLEFPDSSEQIRCYCVGCAMLNSTIQLLRHQPRLSHPPATMQGQD